jgi:transposase InsO family protein
MPNDVAPAKVNDNCLDQLNLPKVIAGPAGEALSRLIAGVADIPAAWLEQQSSRIRNKTAGLQTVSKALADEAAISSRKDAALVYIQPGKPQQNAYVERYNRTVRQEWLGQHIFATIEEARDHATRWLWTYNNERPNMANGGLTPAQKLKNAA